MRDPLQRLNLSPGERRLVMGIVIVTFLVLNYWLVWPRFGEWAQLRDQLDAARRKLDTQRREAERLDVHLATLRKLEGEGGAVPRGEEATAFLTSIQGLTRGRSFPVYSWGNVATPRTGTGATNLFFEERTLTIRATPDEQALVDFLHLLSTTNSAFRVRELTLRPGANDPRSGGPTNLDAVITIVASYQKARPMPATSGRTNAAPAAATNLAAHTARPQ
ncbi:MAG: type II secretion system protein GspM [Limisphaerales bacterium]